MVLQRLVMIVLPFSGVIYNIFRRFSFLYIACVAHTLMSQCHFTKLDLRSGYWQGVVEEHMDSMNSVVSFSGTFPTPYIGRCLDNFILYDCLVYKYDIIIFLSSFEDRLSNLEKGTSRQRPRKGAIRIRFLLQKPR